MILKLLQKSTYWQGDIRTGTGTLTYLKPVIINVRWQYKRELITNSKGLDEVSNAIIYCLIPLETESYIYLGESKEDKPRDQKGSYRIKSVYKTINLYNTFQLVKAWI